MNRKDLNNPQTAVWGIRETPLLELSRRKDLNDPQTAVWGIRETPLLELSRRKDLNDSQTAVWGIRETPLLELSRRKEQSPHCRARDSKAITLWHPQAPRPTLDRNLTRHPRSGDRLL